MYLTTTLKLYALTHSLVSEKLTVVQCAVLAQLFELYSPYHNSHNASVISCLPVPVPAK